MLDIIIVNYNSTDYLINCLESIEKMRDGLNISIYVQDNASTDSPERISSLFPQVIFQRNHQNLGFARAVNQALEKGTGEYVVLLNPDTYIIDNFFNISIAFMQQNPDVGIMGPKILDNDGMLQNSARAFPTPLTAFFGRTSFLSRRFPKNPITSRNLLSMKSDGKSPMEVDWVSGACMVVRRKAIEDIGHLDERFFMYWEDTDWCRRMWESGWKVVYFPQAAVCHYVGGSSRKNIIRSVIEFHKSVYRLFDKHRHPSLSFLNPMVFGGLTIRLFFVLISHFFQWAFSIVGESFKCEERIMKKSLKFEEKNVKDFTLHPSLFKKVKILRIISRLNVGGPAIHVYILTTGLNPEKFESRLITGKISPQEGDMSYLFDFSDNRPIIVPELQREISLKMDIKAFRRIFKILVREKPDIVHTHTAKAGSSTRFAVFIYNLFGHKVLMLHTFHGHVFDGYFSRLNSLVFINIERLLAKVTNVIIAISETQKKDLAEKYRIAPQEKIRKIELGFDLRPFFFSKSLKGQFRKHIGIPDNMLLIGIIGRLVPIKNHIMFFNAAEHFLMFNHGMPVRFIVVGDGELRDILESHCRQRGLTNHVIFCGWIKNVPMVYADLDILALTSLNEGTPVSIIESMSSCVPVIATDAGGVPDLLGARNGYPFSNGFMICERGILCRKNDAFGFANGLNYLVKADRSEKEALIKNARLFVEKRFDYRRLIQDMESLYTELMKAKK